MKLLSVKIFGDNFRSLQANKLYSFNVNDREDRLSTKVFAGLNGSGKSNMLELLAEIFYYLEVYRLNPLNTSLKNANDFEVKGFEIEYYLPMVKPSTKGLVDFENAFEFNMHTRVVKPLGELPEFSRKGLGKLHFERIEEGYKYLLPTKIIAYTSGQNELLSNPFSKIRYYYFKELVNSISTNTVDEDSTENDRLFFIDNSSNFSIFISNMLLAKPEKLKYIKEIFKIQDLHSFRITINYSDFSREKINLSIKIKSNINKLKLCATSWILQKEDKAEILIMDYKVGESTHDAFKFHFETSLGLFNAFYELESLNLHLIDTDTRDLIFKAHKSFNLSDEMPKPDPSRLVFRIEKIFLNKFVEEGKKSKKIYYKGLSDGEHQFNEVVGSVLMMEESGCLFLMDEPDTHFNPIWRSKMIEMLNYVTAYSFDSNGKPEKVRNQEIIITTHSPFVIGDSQTEDVYKFENLNGIVSFVNPKIETYGASIGLLLQEIFGRKISISDLSNSDLNDLRIEIKKLDTDEAKKAKVEETKIKLLGFGESIEKFDIYSLLRQIEKELDNKK